MEEISIGDAANLTTFDPFVWPLCGRLRQAGTTWLAPQIPEHVLVQALTSYLDLADDEVLLAIVAPAADQTAAQSCALTTKRIYWAGDPRPDAAKWDDPDRPAAQAAGPPPVRCDYAAYKDLPETIARTGLISPAINLGADRALGVGGSVPLQSALIAFLSRVRALVRGEEPLPELDPAVADLARRAWPAVLAADAGARALQAQVRTYHAQTMVAIRPVVTYLMAAACLLVFVAMLFRGISPLQPGNAALIAWGANFGPSVVFDGQVWRLLTSMFLHIGLLHLAMNLWCLLTTGPVVERFFGHLGFAALYLLAGIGGAIASLLIHPTFICAGASGAIFGVFGGLLGYLAVRHGEVPAAILQPMRSGTLAFLGYNVLYGLTSPDIDMAAHLGGLATGFVVGILLAARWIARRDRVGLLRRTGLIAALALGLCLLTSQAIGRARVRILADPGMGPQIQSDLDAAPAWNRYSEALTPLLQDFDRIAGGLKRLGESIDQGDVPATQLGRMLDNLIAESDSLGRRLATLPAANPEIRAMSNRMVSAQTHQRHALNVLKRFLASENQMVLEGPDGLEESLKSYVNDFNETRTLREQYFKSHNLKTERP